MSTIINIDPKYNKSYKSKARAISAFQKMAKNIEDFSGNIRYIVIFDEKSGRYVPVGVGQNSFEMVHYGFTVIG